MHSAIQDAIAHQRNGRQASFIKRATKARFVLRGWQELNPCRRQYTTAHSNILLYHVFLSVNQNSESHRYTFFNILQTCTQIHTPVAACTAGRHVVASGDVSSESTVQTQMQVSTHIMPDVKVCKHCQYKRCKNLCTNKHHTHNRWIILTLQH